ncbi:DUF4870 domain-containing protein [Streptobacillus ratti]|uniref:DUF4870 domain-containing protein n=1 Tax=Streptobacillus ratti TaxID=1720557 RepID=UPI000934BE57|nr:DUF4870 domain-containing protein [Streptobacillus ratti]
MKKSIGNINENLVASVILIVSLSPFLGIVFSIGGLILEKENEFVRDYAKQGLIFSFISFILILFKDLKLSDLILTLSFLILLALVVITTIHAYRGEEFKFDFMRKIFEYIKL